MIIGNKNNNPNPMNNNSGYTQSFETRFNTIKEENKKNANNLTPFKENPKAKAFSDPTNKNGMADKSLAILQERLRNGTITMDEFYKQCQKLGKFRQQ